jgi:tryptophan 2,3-dioxygenase
MAAPSPASDYAGYLHLDALLDAQQPRSEPPAHDELLFIVAHQAYELWFKVLIHELEGIRSALQSRQIRLAQHLLNRVHVVMTIMVTQLDALQSMDPQDYLTFRDKLGGGSGLQSVQFRVVELLSGVVDRRLLSIYNDRADRAELERRLAEPSIWDAFAELVSATVTAPTLADGVVQVARDRDRHPQLWELIQSLQAYDRLAARWRFGHVQLVESMIGQSPGTGGTSGMPYLRGRVDVQYFPLLGELASRL